MTNGTSASAFTGLQEIGAPPSVKHEAPGELTTARHPVSATVTLLPLQAEDEPTCSREWRLSANTSAGSNARLRTRPMLTMWRWNGNVDAAARVADKLVDNAIKHGRPFPDGCISLRFALFPTTDELMIEVSDAHPEFPDFAQAVTADPPPRKAPSGLWWVRHYRGRLSWDIKRDNEGHVLGKTVQAILPAINWESPA
ncbi:ATP-binding protein [Streptomyces sp. NPDC054794]